MSEIEELSARVAKLETWVEVVMRTLAGMQVEPVLIKLDEARCAYDRWVALGEWLCGGLAAVLLIAGAAEGVTRHVVEQRIAGAAHKRLSGPVDVSIGSTPALVDVATRHFAKIAIQAPSTSVCQLQTSMCPPPSSMCTPATVRNTRRGSMRMR